MGEWVVVGFSHMRMRRRLLHIDLALLLLFRDKSLCRWGESAGKMESRPLTLAKCQWTVCDLSSHNQMVVTRLVFARV